MKDTTVVVMGLGLVGCGIAIYTLNQKLNKMDANVSQFVSGVTTLTNSIPEIDIKDEILQGAAYNAAKKAADEGVKKISKSITESVNNQVSSAIKTAYSNVEDDVKKKLMDSISVTTIDDIKKTVSNELVKKMFSGSVVRPVFTSGDSKEAIIKTCVENNMAAWEIERILNSLNK